MQVTALFFWLTLSMVFYAYLGYPLLLALFVWVKEVVWPLKVKQQVSWPSVTMIIAAYNEVDCITEKLRNAISLDYPPELLEIWVVTDGSTDRTNELVLQFPRVKLFHLPARKGKINAIQRVMAGVQSGWVVFTDANAMLEPVAIKALMEAGADPVVGVVAGEKRVRHGAAGGVGGESLYWRYEALVKELEGRLYAVTGTAGELYALRTDLFSAVPEDTISDDLEIGWAIVQKGYRIAYAAAAVSYEEEMADDKSAFNRRVRVASGSVQAVMRLIREGKSGWHPCFWWEVVSHRVFRTLIVPYCLPVNFCLNFLLIEQGLIYGFIFLVQTCMYLVAFLIWFSASVRSVSGMLNGVSFFVMAHLAMIKGGWVFLQGRHTVLWERLPRTKATP
jgi:cellulose synthase/poly-beta-1,6-N-acetylglucosamine synthase-like glycosyltransferase